MTRFQGTPRLRHRILVRLPGSSCLLVLFLLRGRLVGRPRLGRASPSRLCLRRHRPFSGDPYRVASLRLFVVSQFLGVACSILSWSIFTWHIFRRSFYVSPGLITHVHVESAPDVMTNK